MPRHSILHEQVFIYASLDPGPRIIERDLGMAWGVGPIQTGMGAMFGWIGVFRADIVRRTTSGATASCPS